ncbi:MAG: hypothetical protein K1X83_02325 [Oligoflexia bacterium]|nr:hypothetical protein [Oligoflexia bacterium]
MRVFTIVASKGYPSEVGLFVEEPTSFVDLFKRAVLLKVETTEVRIAGIDNIIALKRVSGRAQDLQDIYSLELIKVHAKKRYRSGLDLRFCRTPRCADRANGEEYYL